jgi:ParB family transcriptional regulator, chromosome partitioning protein
VYGAAIPYRDGVAHPGPPTFDLPETAMTNRTQSPHTGTTDADVPPLPRWFTAARASSAPDPRLRRATRRPLDVPVAPEVEPVVSPNEPRAAGQVVMQLPVALVDPDPDQPRTDPDPESLDRLARSLESHGQLQPITVRPGPSPGRFTIVMGERRWRACVRAGRPTVAAVVLEGSPAAERRLELQVVENVLREDLSPLDQARAFRALMDHNGWSASRLAETLHVHRATVTRALALLNLPDMLRAHVESGQLSPATAHEIARVDDPDRQRALADRVVAEGLSRAATAEAVRGTSTSDSAAAPSSDTRRVFVSRSGQVTVEVGPPGGSRAFLEAVVDALLEAMDILQAEQGRRRASGVAGQGPPPATPGRLPGSPPCPDRARA